MKVIVDLGVSVGRLKQTLPLWEDREIGEEDNGWHGRENHFQKII